MWLVRQLPIRGAQAVGRVLGRVGWALGGKQRRLVLKQLAEVVRSTGRQYQLEPMNSYQRRIIHTTFKGDPDIETWSPADDARIKRITLRRK